MVVCSTCTKQRGIIKRPKTGKPICKQCFFDTFEREVHECIIENELFTSGQRVAIAASGGKDSTVLAYLINELNKRHGYGIDLVLLSIDEGISGYRDDSLATVQENKKEYGLPLTILSYADLYDGWTMDEVVKRVGLKNNCTYCGVFRRQALDRGAAGLGVDQIITGHNGDDLAETVLMNVLRGDIGRLRRCAHITTGAPKNNDAKNDHDADGGDEDKDESFTPCHQSKASTIAPPITTQISKLLTPEHSNPAKIIRSKPFKYTFEKEIVMYAYFKKLTYFSTECIYAPGAYRGHARAFLKDLERLRPSSILDIIESGEAFIDDFPERAAKKQSIGAKVKAQRNCENCGYISSNALCKACVLLNILNKSNDLPNQVVLKNKS